MKNEVTGVMFRLIVKEENGQKVGMYSEGLSHTTISVKPIHTFDTREQMDKYCQDNDIIYEDDVELEK